MPFDPHNEIESAYAADRARELDTWVSQTLGENKDQFEVALTGAYSPLLETPEGGLEVAGTVQQDTKNLVTGEERQRVLGESDLEGGINQGVIEPPSPLLGRTAGNVLAGAQNVMAGTAGGVDWLANAMGFQSVSNLAHSMAITMEGAARHNTPADAGFADQLAQAAGSMAAFWVPAMGVQVGTAKLASVSARLASILGMGTMTTAESLVEAGAVYTEAQRRGMPPEEANQRATATFIANLPLNFVTNKLGIFGEGTGLRRAASGMLSEGTQEAAQEAISNAALGDPQNLRQIATAGIIGALVGGPAAALTGEADANLRLRTPTGELRTWAEIRNAGLVDDRTFEVGRRLLEHGVAVDDYKTMLLATDAVKMASQDVKDAAGIEGGARVLGETELPNALGDSLIKLYKGHDAETVAHEWYHRIWDHMSPEAKAPFEEWAKKSRKFKNIEEAFADLGGKLFTQERLDLKMESGLQGVVDRAQLGFMRFLGRARHSLGPLPTEIEAMYRDAVLTSVKRRSYLDTTNLTDYMRYKLEDSGEPVEVLDAEREVGPMFYSTLGQFLNAKWKGKAGREPTKGFIQALRSWSKKGQIPKQSWLWEAQPLLDFIRTREANGEGKVEREEILRFLDDANERSYSIVIKGGAADELSTVPQTEATLAPLSLLPVPGAAVVEQYDRLLDMHNSIRASYRIPDETNQGGWWQVDSITDNADGRPTRWDVLRVGTGGGREFYASFNNISELIDSMQDQAGMVRGFEQYAEGPEIWDSERDRRLEEEDTDEYDLMMERREDVVRDRMGNWIERGPDQEALDSYINQETDYYLTEYEGETDTEMQPPESGLDSMVAWEKRYDFIDDPDATDAGVDPVAAEFIMPTTSAIIDLDQVLVTVDDITKNRTLDAHNLGLDLTGEWNKNAFALTAHFPDGGMRTLDSDYVWVYDEGGVLNTLTDILKYGGTIDRPRIILQDSAPNVDPTGELFPEEAENPSLVLPAGTKVEVALYDYEQAKKDTETEAYDTAAEYASDSVYDQDLSEFVPIIYETEDGMHSIEARSWDNTYLYSNEYSQGESTHHDMAAAEDEAVSSAVNHETWGGPDGDVLVEDNGTPRRPTRPLLPDLPGRQIASGTKWQNYVESGAQPGSYRELLFQWRPLPASENYEPAPGGEPMERQTEIAAATIAGPDYSSSHWNESNVLFHLRFDLRNVDGKRTMFLEELQSDWHQAGRSQGYYGVPDLLPTSKKALQGIAKLTGRRHDRLVMEPLPQGEPGPEAVPYSRKDVFRVLDMTKTGGEVVDGYYVIARGKQFEVVGNKGGMSFAPLHSSSDWALAGFKTALRWAAANDVDAIGWTRGAVQVERWSTAMRQRADAIYWEKKLTKDDLQSERDQQLANLERQNRLLAEAEAAVNSAGPQASAEVTMGLVAQVELRRTLARDAQDFLSRLDKQIAEADNNPRVTVTAARKNLSGEFDNEPGSTLTVPLYGSEEQKVQGRTMQVSLEDYVGAEAAKGLRQAIEADEEGLGLGYYEGDLVVGGKGFEGFYDNIMRSAIGKYVKKNWGGEVEAKSYEHRPGEFEQMHFVELPAQAKEMALKVGQARYQLKPTRELTKDVAEERMARLRDLTGSTENPMLTPVDWEKSNRLLAVEWGNLGESVYRGGQTPPKAFNINFAHILSDGDVQDLLARVAQEYEGEIDEARRETITHDETVALAADMSMTPQELLKWRRGDAFNAEQAVAARNVLVASAEELIGLAREVRASNSPQVRYAFQRQLGLHRAIQYVVSGMTAEAGRALGSFNINVGGDLANMAAMDDILAAHDHGSFGSEELAFMLADMDSAAQISKFAKDSERATAWDALYEVWINALLSNPTTHVVNTVSNALVSMISIPERLFAAELSRLSSVLFGTEQEIHEGEVAAMTLGMLRGATEGFRLVWRSIKGESAEAYDDPTTKIEARKYRAISADTFGLPSYSGKNTPLSADVSLLELVGAGIDLLGQAVRLPSQFLRVGDSFFKAINYRMESHAQAFRQARAEGIPVTEMAARIHEIENAPSDELHLAAKDFAEGNTFTRPLKGLAQYVQKAVNAELTPANLPLLRVIVPFIRTPANILGYATDRMPLALAKKNFWQDMAAGGAKRDLALAKMGLGTLVMMAIGWWWEQGNITGAAPEDPGIRNLWDAKGLMPYSIKIGDRWYSYQRLEPLGMLLGTAADFFTIVSNSEWQGAELAGAIFGALSNNMTSKTWLRGVSEMLAVMDDTVRYGPSYIKRLVGSAAPAGIAQVSRVVDPVLREARSIADHLLSRLVPGWSKDLPPRRDIFGEVRASEGSWGPDLLSPVYVSTEKKDPVVDELLRLKAGISLPPKRIGGVYLSPEEYSEYARLAGQQKLPSLYGGGNVDLHEEMERAIESPEYQRLGEGPEGGKALLLTDIVHRYRKAARGKMLESNQELRDTVERTKTERAVSRSPQGAGVGQPIPTR